MTEFEKDMILNALQTQKEYLDNIIEQIELDVVDLKYVYSNLRTLEKSLHYIRKQTEK
jgi:hypothetical protein